MIRAIYVYPKMACDFCRRIILSPPMIFCGRNQSNILRKVNDYLASERGITGWYRIKATSNKAGSIVMYRDWIYYKAPISNRTTFVGKRVRIIDDTCFHEYEIGSIVTIISERHGDVFDVQEGTSFIRKEDFVLYKPFPTELDVTTDNILTDYWR